MKITSSDVAMGSARVFTEMDSTKEKLRTWVGKRPDAVSRSPGDRVVLGANVPLPPPPPKPAKPKEGA